MQLMLNNGLPEGNSSWRDYDCLHPQLIESLIAQNLTNPTPVQAEVFSCYTHYYDFLVAAQTGSGKTLAFGAPILSQLASLLQKHPIHGVLLGLILTPTRELAQQIYEVFRRTVSKMKNQVVVETIVGGMSKHKQIRVLQQHRPHIIIGTPGRIYELLEDEILQFSHLKYLVIDQADRMIEFGHFKEVDKILEKIFDPPKTEHYDKEVLQMEKILKKEQKGEYFVKDGKRRMKLQFNIDSIATDQLFEVSADMFNLIPVLAQPEQDKGKVKKSKHKSQPVRQQSPADNSFLESIKRRIFFISATLTRQFKGTKYFYKKSKQDKIQEKSQRKLDKRNGKDTSKKSKGEQNKSKGRSFTNRDGSGSHRNPNEELSLQESIPKLKALLSRAKFSGKPKIIDQSSLLFLPSTLIEKVSFSEGEIERTCLLIAYLRELPKHAKTIIFSNTIKASKRIKFFLDSFEFGSVALHSHMQQKQRLSKLQKFSRSCNLLIATDVAARGLDFHITHVIQMGVPVNGDTYVHRAGRTARANLPGQSFIIVDKKEANRWTEINDIINGGQTTRKVVKYFPANILMQQIQESVDKFEWIRLNNQNMRDERMKVRDRKDAEEVGVEIEEEQRSGEEKQMIRQEVKRKIKRITQETNEVTSVNARWKKNKFIMSNEDIRKLL